MRQAMWAALLVAGSARADTALLKEEMAAIRKELVQVRMEQRRLEARTEALTGKRAKAAEMLALLPEVRAAVKDDAALNEMRGELDRLLKHLAHIERVMKPEAREKEAAQIAKRVHELKRSLHDREQAVAEKTAFARESLELAERKTYLVALRKTLEADLAQLADEAKKRGE